MNGVFLTFEGGEGAGKTTQIAALSERLRARGRDVVQTREPGGTPLGIEIRRRLVCDTDDPPTPVAELLLYAADRSHHVERLVRPQLRAGGVVLCDRYADATEAYQGYGRGLDLDVVRAVNAVATGGLWPHRTLWIDVEPQEGVRRSLERIGGGDERRFESEALAFHDRVRAGYAAIAAREPERFRRIDGVGSPEVVFARVWAAVEDLFRG
jgi:dTMP kinase